MYVLNSVKLSYGHCGMGCTKGNVSGQVTSTAGASGHGDAHRETEHSHRVGKRTFQGKVYGPSCDPRRIPDYPDQTGTGECRPIPS